MIDNLKKSLRIKIKDERKKIDIQQKQLYDQRIAQNLINSNILKDANLVLIYISTDIEVGTKEIINYCFENSIPVAVPRCIGPRKMNFYYYNKNTVLEKSGYGIMEPLDSDDSIVKSFENALCIVPGLSFDKNGYRLGYGGGFYDNFLSMYSNIKKVGVCYQMHITDKLPIGEFDNTVDYLVTENYMEECNGK